MNLQPDSIYHIFNRGNNKQQIFFSHGNYYYFRNKIEQQLNKTIDLLAFCLMPNHFHLLISTDRNFDKEKFSNQFRILLSSYTRAINIQEQRTGSLFQQNTKSVELGNQESTLTCLNYIHFNPVKAGLAKRMQDWRYSSIHEYIGKQQSNICNVALATELIDLPKDQKQFMNFSKDLLPENYSDLIF